MHEVRKFPLHATGDLTFEMPARADLLHVAVQNGKPCLWARVNPKAGMTGRRVRVAGTGQPLGTDTGRHVGSFVLANGADVYHVFEVV